MNLFDQITAALDQIQHGWTSPEKAHVMAAMVLALRPDISLEIGVYAGKGLVTLGLAHKYVKYGRAIGVDPYSSTASVQGQTTPEDRKFWEHDHEPFYKMACDNLKKFGVAHCTSLIRKTSEEYDPPPGIGILRVDGNHGPQAVTDVMKYAGVVVKGGFLLLDDIGWTGSYVKQAAEWLRHHAWRELYTLDDGVVFQK